MSANALCLTDFDRTFEEAGVAMLDSIFSKEQHLRELVSVRSPRECRDREVLLKVSYADSSELSSIISIISKWVSCEDRQQDLEGLMLF